MYSIHVKFISDIVSQINKFYEAFCIARRQKKVLFTNWALWDWYRERTGLKSCKGWFLGKWYRPICRKLSGGRRNFSSCAMKGRGVKNYFKGSQNPPKSIKHTKKRENFNLWVKSTTVTPLRTGLLVGIAPNTYFLVRQSLLCTNDREILKKSLSFSCTQPVMA